MLATVRSNQEFCYWLQGYFEITAEPLLTEKKLLLMASCLKNIREPLGPFTQWLLEVIEFLEKLHFSQAMIDLFLPEIQNRLNAVFFHVIDNGYDRTVSLESARKIHAGLPHD